MVGRSLAVAALALGLSARQADAHGAVTIPMPREAIDGDTAPWNGKVPWPIPFGASSPCPSSELKAHQLTDLVRADKPNWCAHPSAAAAGNPAQPDRRERPGLLLYVHTHAHHQRLVGRA